MRHLAVLVPCAVFAAAAALASGCAATPPPPSRPPTAVALSERSALAPTAPAGEETATSSIAAPQDAFEPPRPAGPEASDRLRAAESQAADEVIGMLGDEGLLVLELGTELEHADPQRATVVVAVLHGTGRSHPHETRYRVRLLRAGGAWRVLSIEAVS
jgi:hypothetical protein